MKRQIRLWYGSPLVEALAVTLPALPFGLGVGYATGRYLACIVTSLAISGTTYALFKLDIAFVHPLFQRLPPNRAVMMEILTGLMEFVFGTWLAFSLCAWILDHPLEGTQVWWLVGGTVASITIFHTLTYTFFSHAEMKRKIAEEKQLRAMATAAELKALKAQINPHFLFNTLNTIASLIHSEPAQAEVTVERLAGMFRYVLVGTERGLVPIREELAFVDDYLKIEQARFGECLRITREIEPDTLDVPVPSLILQPLVENAVQHGRGDSGEIDLTIRVHTFNDTVEMSVADKGPGMPTGFQIEAGSGYGLHNVHERLTKTYGGAYGVRIASNKPQGTIVTLAISPGEKA